ARIEARSGELAFRGEPGVAEIRKGALENAKADAAEAVDAVQRDAIGEIRRCAGRVVTRLLGRLGLMGGGHRRQRRESVNVRAPRSDAAAENAGSIRVTLV